MSEKKCECKCNSKPKELPVMMGGIVVYELAIIIVLLILIYLDLDAPCENPHSITSEQEEVTSIE
jgi:hypothetical protein